MQSFFLYFFSWNIIKLYITKQVQRLHSGMYKNVECWKKCEMTQLAHV